MGPMQVKWEGSQLSARHQQKLGQIGGWFCPCSFLPYFERFSAGSISSSSSMVLFSDDEWGGGISSTSISFSDCCCFLGCYCFWSFCCCFFCSCCSSFCCCSCCTSLGHSCRDGCGCFWLWHFTLVRVSLLSFIPSAPPSSLLGGPFQLLILLLSPLVMESFVLVSYFMMFASHSSWGIPLPCASRHHMTSSRVGGLLPPQASSSCT